MQFSIGRIGQLKNGSRGRLSKQERREELQFYLFILPWIIGFILFGGGPIIASGVISFTNWSLLSRPQWIGFQNYVQLYQDPLIYMRAVKRCCLLCSRPAVKSEGERDYVFSHRFLPTLSRIWHSNRAALDQYSPS